MIRQWRIWLCLIAGVVAAESASAANPQVDHVVIVSVDGLHPGVFSVLSPAQIPSLTEIASGASTLNARTAHSHTITLPNHTCMVTGRPVLGASGHLYTDNGDPGTNVTLHTNAGTYIVGVFDVAHDRGLRTAIFAGKTKFSVFDVSWNGAFNPVWGDINGAVDSVPPDNGRDKIDFYQFSGNAATLANGTAAELTAAAGSRSLIFLHFHDPDSTGHGSGWNLTPGSPYLQSIMTVDAALGTVLSTIDGNPQLKGNTAIIVTSDHGGTGTGHGDASDPANYIIPFLVWLGDDLPPRDLYSINSASRTDPGVGRPLDAPAPNQPIRNGDAANLALDLLGLPPVPGSVINASQNLQVVPASEVFCETFESGFTLGSMVGTHPDWFDGGNGPVVAGGAGVAGSVGLQPGTEIFTWIAQPFDWNDADLSAVAVQLDVQTDANGILDDDRVGWMIADDSASSDFIFGVQVDPTGDATDGLPAGSLRLEGYWDADIGVVEDRRPEIDIVAGSLLPNTFYRLRAEITKLSATSAQVAASLTQLDGSGNPVAGPPVLSGVIADTSLLGADAPDAGYFTGPIWPGYKSFTSAGANADNACVEFVGAGPGQPDTVLVSFQQGINGYASTVDTFLDSQNPNTSNAAATTLIVDQNPLRHILLRFDDIFGADPGKIPPGASILSATLTINVTNESVGVGASLYRMLQTWNDTDTWNTWGNGIQNNGIEAATTADTSGNSGTGLFSLNVTTSLAAWASNPGSNHGWAWLPPAQDNSWQFNSAEGGTPPRLEVLYELVCSNSLDCDDDNLCTTDTCTGGACLNEPIECDPGQVCYPLTGACVDTLVLTFQEGLNSYVGTQDTTLQESAPGNVNGALQEWEWDDDDPNGGAIQRNFGLLRFDNIFGGDPDQIPPGAEILSASLAYTAFDPGVTGSVREMLVDWNESNNLTDICGASCDQGVDFASNQVAAAPGVVGTQTLNVTSSLIGWAKDPSSHRGWIFLPTTGADGGVQVRSSEYVAAPSLRPMLTVVLPLRCEQQSDCDDGNPCTDDSCETNGLCTHVNNTDSCDDGHPCTEFDTCSSGGCNGVQKDCGSQVCNPTDGMCVDCVTNGHCDDGDVCNGEEVCNLDGECEPGVDLVCDDGIACTDDSCHPANGCQHADNCPLGQQCNMDTGDCEAAPLLIAYNDMNTFAGDANAPNVTTHTYLAVNGVLKDFNSGMDSTITMTGTTIGGYDANHPTNGGQANAGTDAGDIFGPAGSVIVDLSNTMELDAEDWDHIITFNNLNPSRVYTITLTANRNNPDYNNARYTRVTIEGADTFTNASSPGVVVNSPSSVSFSSGYNTVNGYVARWTNVTAADGSFSVKSEWDNTLGAGASNTKGYAMGAFRLEESSTLCDVPSECNDGLFCNGIEDCVSGVCVSGAPPCTDPDLPVCDEDIDACLVNCELTLLSEDFNGFSAGANPPGWFDTAPLNSLTQDDSQFSVINLGGNLVFGTTSTATNIHSHYTAGGASAWSNYEYTGRMRISDTDGGIGVTFHSQFPNQAAYYRLRRFAGNSFHISPFGASISGGVTDTLVTPLAGEWYRFRIQVEDTGTQTQIRARVWLDNNAEPGAWQVDCFDSNPGRLTSGTVGVWSFNTGNKLWDDLAVTTLNGMEGPCNDGDPCTVNDLCEDGVCAGVFADCDGDGVCDAEDNCPSVPNPGQADSDLDGFGDACDNLFDADHDGDVDLSDYEAMADCLGGANNPPSPSTLTQQECLDTFDADGDGDVDLEDFEAFTRSFTGATAPNCD